MKLTDGSVRLMLGKKINGHSIILETVSKGRMSLHPVTAYQIDSSDYLKYYKTRAIDRSSTSRSENTDTVDISRPAIALNNNISQTMPGVNEEDFLGGQKDGSRNWSIKKDASLDGGSHDPKAASSDVSSDASTNSISQTVPGVNGEKTSPKSHVTSPVHLCALV